MIIKNNKQFNMFPSHVGLRKYVLYYNIAFPASDTFMTQYTLIPNACGTLSLAFDGNAVIAELWGASQTPVLLGTEPNSYRVLLLVQLSSYGLYQITRQHQAEFAGKRLLLADIDKELFNLLYEAFAISKTMVELVNICERILYKRMEKWVVSDSLLLATKAISDRHGQIGVKEIARQSCYSERQLNRLFLTQIGMTVKTYARITRFNYSFTLKRRRPMNWEPWTGCYKASDGCTNCYFYGPHAKRYGQNTIQKTDKFDWPIRRNTKGEYNIKGNKILATCFATDFFLPEADAWRKEIWMIIKERTDIEFLILTKRIERFLVSLPPDWGSGYDNVNIGCTVENQKIADYRLPLFLSYPIKRRFIACAPLLEPIDLTPYLHGVDHVTVGGETGREARECDYDWVLHIRGQCVKANTTFWFKNTGSLFKRNGIVEKINPFKQTSTAKELCINISDGKKLF